MDARQVKAEQLADQGRITFAHGAWFVPSQTNGRRHRVVLDALFPTCTCEDFALRDQPCKHIRAARLVKERQAAGVEPPVPTMEPTPKVKRPTYSQDWENYNQAAVHEKEHFQELLFDLCTGIQEPLRKPGPGRLPIPRCAAVFAAIFKVYSTFSGRRFMTDLREAKAREYIDKVPHFNSIFNCLEDKALTPLLHQLVRVTALPLKSIETKFAADSSGFCTSRFQRWFDVKYGVTRESAVWVKAHIMCGVHTNVITACEILGPHAADVSQFPALVKATATGFKIEEASADMAYAATDNFQAVEDVGGMAYIPFRKSTTGAVGGIFERAFHYFLAHRDEFLKHYHLRSNVESTISMVKAKFRDHVRSKTDTAMVNEVLCKFIGHNLCCLIATMYELKLEPVFWGSKPDAEPIILPLARPG